tara:strand:- start:1813 stop:2817 length:1005 start_codon:yes stop_codon:yes gene_type:complete
MKNKIYYWSSENFKESGEGQLSILFLKILKKKLKNKKFVGLNSFKYRETLFYKYFLPFYGVLKIWFYHFQGYKTVYVNYLPLWNFLIFLLIPKKCLIGPITGTKYINQKANFFQKNIRKFIFPIFFYISVKILKYQNRYVIFSNNNFLNLKNKIKSIYNFQILYFKTNKKKIKKNIDIFVYLRSHSNKNSEKIEKIVNYFKHSKYKILVVGKNFHAKNIKSIKYLKNEKLNYFLKRSQLVLLSSEILLTFFCLDALNNNCKVVFFRNFNNEERLLDKSSYVKILSRSTKEIINHIKKELTHRKRKNLNSKFKILLNEKKKTIDLINKYFNKNII